MVTTWRGSANLAQLQQRNIQKKKKKGQEQKEHKTKQQTNHQKRHQKTTTRAKKNKGTRLVSALNPNLGCLGVLAEYFDGLGSMGSGLVIFN
jgi:hypothetical protein